LTALRVLYADLNNLSLVIDGGKADGFGRNTSSFVAVWADTLTTLDGLRSPRSLPSPVVQHSGVDEETVLDG
jgi:hypothetical protein